MRGNPVRKTVLYGAAGAILCVAGLLVWAFAASTDRTSWPLDGDGVLLWAVQGETPDGVGARALGVVSLAATGACFLLIPTDLSVKGSDGRLVELGDLGASRGWAACCDAVESILGVRVSGYATLRWSDAEAFCDAFGPIPVEIPGVVTYRAAGVEEPLVVGRGKQELGGATFLAYVAGASEKESAAERSERGLRALLAEAAGEETSARAFRRVGSSLPRSELVSLWRRLTACRDTLKVEEVPTSVIVRDGVGRRVALAVETRQLVAKAIRAKELLTPEAISVAVFNGSGARLVATKAAQYLEARGFQIMAVGNADVFTYALTTIVRLTDEAKAWILRDTLPGAAKVVTQAEFGTHYEALRAKVPVGTDLVLVVGAGMEWNG